MVIEEMRKHEPEQEHTLFDMFILAAETLTEERMHDGLESVQSFLQENYTDLYLGPEWYEYTISKYDGNLINRLEMLRLCALKIQEVKNAGDGSEEQAL